MLWGRIATYVPLSVRTQKTHRTEIVHNEPWSSNHKPPMDFICLLHPSRKPQTRSKDCQTLLHYCALNLFFFNAIIQLIPFTFCRSRVSLSVSAGGPCEQHAQILASKRVWKSKWSQLTDGNTLTRLKWISGCVMCDDMMNGARAFFGGCVANSSFLASLRAAALC